MREREKARLRKRVKRLKEHISLTIPVSVRFAAVSQKPYKTCAITTFDGATIHIRIHPQQSYASAVDALLHEWAHARVLCQAFEHGEAWGKEYAKAFEIDESLRGGADLSIAGQT